MLTQILSISSILLGIYLLIIFLKNSDISRTFLDPVQYHMGCFSQDNVINHSISVKDYIANVGGYDHTYIAEKRNFEVDKRVDYNQISKGVARDFEKYLSEYYQIKTKGIYEQSYYRSLSMAEDSFQSCKEMINKEYGKEYCLNSWNQFQASTMKYDELKDALKIKIQRKEQQEKKISSMILGNNYQNSQQFETNITNQISALNLQAQEINVKKIRILQKKSPLELFIVSNKTKLQEDESLLDQCVKNMKIITFCNELNNQLSSLKITLTKQDIQTKIQRKKYIIEAFSKTIKNAQKLGDVEMAEMGRKNLQKNQNQLSLLELRIQEFESYEESYCSKCSDQKISQLRIDIQNRRIIISQHQQEYNTLIEQEQKLSRQSASISAKISQLEEQKDFHIKGNICVTKQCQDKRYDDLKKEGIVLNEMKKQALDYRFIIESHKIDHENSVAGLNGWTNNLNRIVDCLYRKQYYQALRERKPEQSQNQVMKIQKVKNQLVKKLQTLGK